MPDMPGVNRQIPNGYVEVPSGAMLQKVDYAVSNTGVTTYTYTWTVWNMNYTSASTMIPYNNVTSIRGDVWPQWTTQYATTIQTTQIASGTNTMIWDQWNQNHSIDMMRMAQRAAAGHQPTQAELRALEERRQREQREYAERTARRTQEISAAKRRAEDLLRRHLTPQQIEDLEKKNCFYLESIGRDGQRRRYRIDRGTHGNVKLLDKDGRIIGSYCVQPDNVPAEDAMLAQKLWLETDEEAFKKVANFTRHAA